MRRIQTKFGIFLLIVVASSTYADDVTVGPDGIDSERLGLTGDGVAIGMVEDFRPGDPALDSPEKRNSSVDPIAVYLRDIDAVPAMDTAVSDHATGVASVMISTDETVKGVSPGADLYASGHNPGPGDDLYPLLASTLQFVATRNGGDVRAMNLSYALNFSGETQDGNSPLSQFVDWSSRVHDTLYVIAGDQGPESFPHPTDSFNGLTVARSRMNGGVFREVSPQNDFTTDADGDRTSTDLLAPGDQVFITVLDDRITSENGTSYAAPHVVGTVALLQQHANTQIAASQPHWTGEFESRPTAVRHEVMKAVLMNSADKLIDDGTIQVGGVPVQRGGLLGMSRTVIDQDGNNWLDSEAYDDEAGFGFGTGVPLDDQMGAGHLNAFRAYTQFAPGEYDPDKTGVDNPDVPLIGWDYDTTQGVDDGGLIRANRYRFAEELAEGSFVSITLAWDRHVVFDNDADMDGEYDPGDTFERYTPPIFGPPEDDVVNDLEIYLLPKFAANEGAAVAEAIASVGTLEHLFFQIPETGEYEFWIKQFDDEVSPTQSYGVAWWAVAPDDLITISGDFNRDMIVDADDYTEWKNEFGNFVSPGTGADGNGDGIINLADYTVWRDNLGATSALSTQAVPEPGSWLLLLLGGLFVFTLKPRCV